MSNLQRSLFCALLAVVSFQAHAALAARRALVIGIADYQNVNPLQNPRVDASNMSAALLHAGYAVTKVTDPEATEGNGSASAKAPDTTRQNMLLKIGAFLKTIRRNDEVVVYYSGHGVDVNGDNMLVPSDSPSADVVPDAASLSQILISVRPLMSQIEDHSPSIQVWIIDACRENPYNAPGKGFGKKGGLVGFGDQTNSFIFFSANYNQVARDTLPSDPKDAHLGSPYTRTFVKMFDAWKGRDADDYAKEIRRQVHDLVKPDPQYPMYENGVLGEWCFSDCQENVQRIQVAGATPKLAMTAKTSAGVATFLPSNAEAMTQYTSGYGSARTVFLGKESSHSCVEGTVNNKYPFGCKVLRELSQHFNSGASSPAGGLVGSTISVATDVWVHKGLPTQGRDGSIYGCKVEILKPGVKTRLAATVALAYAGDVFYWGVVDGPTPQCAA